MLRIVQQLPSWKLRQTHQGEGKKTLQTFNLRSHGIMSWDHSLTNSPLGNVIIAGNLSKLEDRENWDPCCCNARIFLSLIDLWAENCENFALLICKRHHTRTFCGTLPLRHPFTSSIYLASSALNLWYVPFCYWQPREQSLGIFFWNHKKSRNQLLSWWIWRVSPCLLGGYQESTQNSSLLPQVNTNLFNLIAWMRNKGRCILI